jgi:hypothetical protein
MLTRRLLYRWRLRLSYGYRGNWCVGHWSNMRARVIPFWRRPWTILRVGYVGTECGRGHYRDSLREVQETLPRPPARSPGSVIPGQQYRRYS